jgi:methionyl-tRNA formyltransferase
LTSKPSIVFIGTPDFSGEILEHIYNSGIAEVKAVFTMPSRKSGRGRKLTASRIVRFCIEQNIKLYQPENINDSENIIILKTITPDMCFISAYGKIIKKAFFEIPKYGTFNLHFSLLPQYRGASPVQMALLHGNKVSGLTIQQIEEKMDTGAISKQVQFSIQDMFLQEMFDICVVHAKTLLTDFFNDFPASVETLAPQDHTKATYCSKLEKGSGLISIQMTAENAYNMIRAYTPWPGVYFYVNGKRYVITNAKICNEKVSAVSGTLVKQDKHRLLLILQDSMLEIINIKPENKKELNAAAFLNGSKLEFPVEIDKS